MLLKGLISVLCLLVWLELSSVMFIQILDCFNCTLIIMFILVLVLLRYVVTHGSEMNCNSYVTFVVNKIYSILFYSILFSIISTSEDLRKWVQIRTFLDEKHERVFSKKKLTKISEERGFWGSEKWKNVIQCKRYSVPTDTQV